MLHNDASSPVQHGFESWQPEQHIGCFLSMNWPVMSIQHTEFDQKYRRRRQLGLFRMNTCPLGGLNDGQLSAFRILLLISKPFHRQVRNFKIDDLDPIEYLQKVQESKSLQSTAHIRPIAPIRRCVILHRDLGDFGRTRI